MIIAISGTPCTGKSSIAKELGKMLGYSVVNLNELAEHNNLYSGYDEKRKCKIVDLDKVREELRKIVNNEKNLIIESHYAHEFSSDVVIVLKCSPKELMKRMKNRKWGKAKIEENVEAEIMEVCKTDALELGRKVIEIDTTKKNPKMVAEEINKKISYKS